MKRVTLAVSALSIVLAIAIVGVSINFVMKKARSVKQELHQHALDEAQTPSTSHSANLSGATPSATPSSLPLRKTSPSVLKDPETLWKPFQQRYGENLKSAFLPSGFLASVRGSRGNAGGTHGTSRNFRSEDTTMVTARAQEIVEAASGLLGVQAESPLGTPQIRGNEISAQITFREMHNTLPVSPGGIITLDLGAQGEVIGIYSSYIHDIALANRRILTEEQAREKANAAVTESKTVINVEPGLLLIWIEKRAEGSTPARGLFAYEYMVHGFQVIVNAEDGSILQRRDQRQY
ncbi:hypothetical protein WDW86_01275 [Bdellovibrionota bacterium FG-2]